MLDPEVSRYRAGGSVMNSMVISIDAFKPRSMGASAHKIQPRIDIAAEDDDAQPKNHADADLARNGDYSRAAEISTGRM